MSPFSSLESLRYLNAQLGRIGFYTENLSILYSVVKLERDNSLIPSLDEILFDSLTSLQRPRCKITLAKWQKTWIDIIHKIGNRGEEPLINYLLCSPVGIDAKKYNRGEGLARLYSNGSKFVCKCIDCEFFKMQSTILTTLETGYNVAINSRWQDGKDCNKQINVINHLNFTLDVNIGVLIKWLDWTLYTVCSVLPTSRCIEAAHKMPATVSLGAVMATDCPIC